MFMTSSSTMARTSRHWPCQGIALIESLVAILVLALGIAGLALVQARSLADGRSTSGRAIAILLVDDLANRMMFNRETARSNGYRLSWGETPNSADCQTTACDGASLARSDLYAWRAAVVALLPAGNATVFQTEHDLGQVGIAISWAPNEGRAADRDAAKYRQPFAITVAANGIACPDNSICHLVYVQP